MPPIRLTSFVNFITECLQQVWPTILVRALRLPQQDLPYPYGFIDTAPMELVEESGPLYAQYRHKYGIMVVNRIPDDTQDIVPILESEANRLINLLEAHPHIDTDAPEFAGQFPYVTAVSFDQLDADEHEYIIALTFEIVQESQRGYA